MRESRGREVRTELPQFDVTFNRFEMDNNESLTRGSWPGQLLKQGYLWGIPLVVVAVLTGLYFSGVDLLREIMAPSINREYGVVENLQHVMLIWAAVIAFAAIKLRQAGIEKLGLAALSVVCIFFFLEEIDYGLHYYETIMDVPEEDRSTVRNLHNINETHRFIRTPMAVSYVIFFSILPWFRSLRIFTAIKSFIPNKLFVLAPIGLAIPATLAHAFANLGDGDTGALLGNYSEFAELYMYYVLFVYVRFAARGVSGLPIR